MVRSEADSYRSREFHGVDDSKHLIAEQFYDCENRFLHLWIAGNEHEIFSCESRNASPVSLAERNSVLCELFNWARWTGVPEPNYEDCEIFRVYGPRMTDFFAVC